MDMVITKMVRMLIMLISFTSQLLPPLPPGPLVVIVCGGNLVTLDLVQVPDSILTRGFASLNLSPYLHF